MMSLHLLKTAGLSTTGPPVNISGSTSWKLDGTGAGTGGGGGSNNLLVGVSVAVFGFPALVICLICAFRLRVYYVDRRDTKLGFHTTVEESSLLAVEECGSRSGSHVNIKLSTINEALHEDEEPEYMGGGLGYSRPTVVTFDTTPCPDRKDSV